MQVKELKNKGLQREYEVTLEAKEINQQVDKKLKEVSKNAKMPGFRPGKVPLQVVKKKHGKAIMDEVLQRAVSDSSKKMMSERELKPAMQPKIDIASFDPEKENSDLVYNISFEIYPDIPEVDLTVLSIDNYIVDISDAEVDESIDRLLQSQKKFTPVSNDRAAKKGDAVLIDFLGKVADKAFEGGAAKGFQLELGSGQFIPGFEDQLVGAKKGSKKDVKVTFPVKYGSSDLAGKDAVFEVAIHDVLEAELPKFDDEFAKKLGIDNVEKLKEVVREQIIGDFDVIVRTKIKKEMFDTLDREYKFEVPAGMVSLELSTIKESAKNIEEEKAGDAKELEKQDKEYKVLAERRVRLGIILADIGRKNAIAVTEEELRKAVFEQARNYPGQEQKVIEFYQKSREALEQLKGPILEDKVVNYITSKIKLVEKKVTTKELLKFEAGEE